MVTTVENILQNLFENRVSNAFKVLPIYLEHRWNYYDDKSLFDSTIRYLSENFGYDGSLEEFSVFIVSSTNVYYRSPDLFYYSNSDNQFRSVVVGLGKVWSKYSCDEDNQLMVKVKLTCFKFGDSHISYHGENVKSFNPPGY